MADDKPRIRVPAGGGKFTADSYQNYAAGVGIGTQNLASHSLYGFNPLSRNRNQLDWMYRGSWLVKTIVDAVAEDMTRAGTTFESDMPPDRMDKLTQYITRLQLWPRITSAIKWSRLYGGCIAVVMIDGQKLDTPLRLDTIQKDQFLGLNVLDRWRITPELQDLVTDFGPDYGLPKYYTETVGITTSQNTRIHHSRCIRLDGVELPYWQRQAENSWGLSVVEPFYDRLVAFDSVTQGASQLAYRAHLRILKVDQLRDLIGIGGPGLAALQTMLAGMRQLQSNEGVTVVDKLDEFEVHQTTFGGLADLIIQFAQQVSGAAQIPLVRLFGQSPAGLNATGESDIRNYYDAINAQQESRLRRPLHMLFDICHRSLFGTELPEGFDFIFNPLWQLSDEQKADIALNITNSVVSAHAAGIIQTPTAMKELRQQSKISGVFSNITDEEIDDAEEAPPPGMLLPAAGAPGAAGQKALPGQPAGGQKALQAPQQAPKQIKPSFTKAPDPTADTSVTRDVYGIRLSMTQDSYGSVENKLHCIVGNDAESRAAWLVTEIDPANGEFDKFEAVLCAGSRDEAMDLYTVAHPGNEARIGNVKRMSVDALRAFIGELSPTTSSNGAIS